MPEDEDHSVGISVDWSVQGFKAGIKSRWLSALDLLGARRVAALNAAVDRQTSISQALTSVQVGLINTAREAIEKQIADDPNLAAKLLMALGRAERDAENIGAALDFALQDLSNSPRSGDNDDQSTETINADVVNRWERYAADANSEAAREKWGKVLASEIRGPGTFSLQTLRIIDELDPDVARVFERLCQNRFKSWVPVVTGEVTLREVEELQHAGLLLHRELFASVTFNSTEKNDGSGWWALGNEQRSVAVSKSTPTPTPPRLLASLDDVRVEDGKLQINVHTFTRAGNAIATIVPYDGEVAVKKLASALAVTFGSENVVVLRPNGDSLVVDDDWKPSQTS